MAGAIVATCFGCFAEARLALPDLPLAFCITLTIWSAMRAADEDLIAWWLLAGLGAGLGFLMKGPVAIVLPGIVLVPIWFLERRRVRLRASGIALAIVVFVAIGLPWYIAMWRVHGTEYLRFFFLENNVERFATRRYSGPRSALFYVPIVIGGLIPWCVYLVAFAVEGLIGIVKRRAVWSQSTWRVLLWAVVPLIFYTASLGKQPRYILPVITPIAILVGRGLAARIDRARHGRASVCLVGSTWVTAALFSLLAGLLLLARPLFITAYPTLTVAGIVALSLAAGAIAWVATVHAWGRLPAVLAVSGAALMLTIQFGALAGRRPEAVEEMAALVRAHRTGGERVGEYQVFVRNLVFYLGFRQDDLYDLARAKAFVQSPDRVLLVVRASDAASLQEQAGVPLTILGSVRYLNTANLRVATVLTPDAADVGTVVLVTNR
jgi:4-amino-4-deoxy-L-arabinose transferase-like glycosyltransferase